MPSFQLVPIWRVSTKRTFHQIWSYRLEITIYIFIFVSSSHHHSSFSFFSYFPKKNPNETSKISSNFIFHLRNLLILFSSFIILLKSSSHLIPFIYVPNPIDRFSRTNENLKFPEPALLNTRRSWIVNILLDSNQRIGEQKMMMKLLDDDTVDNEESFHNETVSEILWIRIELARRVEGSQLSSLLNDIRDFESVLCLYWRTDHFRPFPFFLYSNFKSHLFSESFGTLGIVSACHHWNCLICGHEVGEWIEQNS